MGLTRYLGPLALPYGRVRATVEPVSSSKSMVSKEKAEFTVPELKLGKN